MSPPSPAKLSTSLDSEYVTLQNKGNFAAVAKLRILRSDIILDYLVGSDVITRFLELGGKRLERREDAGKKEEGVTN